MTPGTAQSKRKTKEIISFPFSRKFSFNSESSSSLRLCFIPGHLQTCYIKLWKATATAPERRSTKLADKWQLCAFLPCVALQHPVRILPRKTVLILKINQLFSTKAQRVPKNARLRTWVRGQRIAMTIWYDPERSIRIWCLHEDDGLSFPYRLQKFPLFLSSSYRLQKFADTDRLRVNRRPIRKDFFPDRYDFVPIVFTSSSCKRGLNW